MDIVFDEYQAIKVATVNMRASLASPLSGYMTGGNYRVDGGQIRSIN